MMIKVCPICEAKFIDGQLYWSTNKKGDPLDLAGLVCNNFRNGREGCLNPLCGCEGGDTWEKRAGVIDAFSQELVQKPSSDIDISYEHEYTYEPLNLDYEQ